MPTDTTTTARDPRCGMTVEMATAPHATRAGHTFYFCCDHCLDAWRATPAGTRAPAEAVHCCD